MVPLKEILPIEPNNQRPAQGAGGRKMLKKKQLPRANGVCPINVTYLRFDTPRWPFFIRGRRELAGAQRAHQAFSLLILENFGD